MALKFDHIHLRCQDLEAAVDYYVKVFGGRVVRRSEVRGMPVVRVEVAGQMLALSPRRAGDEVEPLSGRPRWGMYQLGFEVVDIEAAVEELKSKGAAFEAEPALLTPAVKAAFIEAPDGVQIEILEYL